MERLRTGLPRSPELALESGCECNRIGWKNRSTLSLLEIGLIPFSACAVHSREKPSFCCVSSLLIPVFRIVLENFLWNHADDKLYLIDGFGNLKVHANAGQGVSIGLGQSSIFHQEPDSFS